MAACSYRQTLTSHRSSRGHIQLPTRKGRCQCADIASGLTGRNLASGLLKDDSMRLLIAPSSTLFAALALALLSACGIEDEGLIEPGLPAPSVADTAPSVDQIADPIDSVMPTAIRIRHCYSTCSSDPNKGWTKTHTVGTCSSDATCSAAAKAFCSGLSSGYKYHNSACT